MISSLRIHILSTKFNFSKNILQSMHHRKFQSVKSSCRILLFNEFETSEKPKLSQDNKIANYIFKCCRHWTERIWNVIVQVRYTKLFLNVKVEKKKWFFIYDKSRCYKCSYQESYKYRSAISAHHNMITKKEKKKTFLMMDAYLM